MALNPIKLDDSKIALLYLIAREFNEDLDLDRTLRRVLNATARVVGATAAGLFILDERQNFNKSLFISANDTDIEETDLILQQELAVWVKTHQEMALIGDIRQDKRWHVSPGDPDQMVRRSAISAPLLAGQKIIGILTVTHHQPDYFDRDDLSLLSAIADQATTAVLNAQVHQSEQRRRKLSNMLTEFSQQLNATADLKALFELIFDQLARIIDYDQGLICLINQGYLTITAARGLANLDELRNIPVRLYKNDFALPLTQEYTPLLAEDLQTKNTWFRDVTDVANRSWIGAPLASNDALLGLITVARRSPGVYAAEDMEIVNTLASQAAIAVRNAGLLNQLQGAKRRYTSLFEESSDLILIMDAQGIILDVNRKACQMLRRPKDALIGSDLALLGLNLRKTFNQQAAKLARGQEVTAELTMTDAYRQEIPVEITTKQVEIEGKIATQWIGRDMTARRQLDQIRQDLMNMIVHDLRGPLGTLLGSVELLPFLVKAQASEESITESLELLQVALYSGKILRDLVDSMLDLTRLEQGTFPLNLHSVNLQELLLEVEKQIALQADSKDILLSFEPVDPALTFDLDRSVIRRVLVNLVDNAIKYTPSRGQVDVKVFWNDEILTFKVIDNGPGVPPEKQKEIFDKFSRVDHYSRVQGVGLGLAFCKMAVEAHKGQIWIESQLGIGSTFIVEIPYNLAAQRN